MFILNKKLKKTIDSVDTIIMRLIDKQQKAKNSNIIKLIDLSLNLNLCIFIKNKRKLTLRMLGEDVKEDMEKIQNLLNNAIEIIYIYILGILYIKLISKNTLINCDK